MTLERIRQTNNGCEIFAVKGPDGGAHFHYTPNEESEKRWGSCNCGIEIHCKKPVYEGQSGRDECWLIGCKCYHDGSTTQAIERFMPAYQYGKHDDFKWLWSLVEEAYYDRVQLKAEVEEAI